MSRTPWIDYMTNNLHLIGVLELSDILELYHIYITEPERFEIAKDQKYNSLTVK